MPDFYDPRVFWPLFLAAFCLILVVGDALPEWWNREDEDPPLALKPTDESWKYLDGRSRQREEVARVGKGEVMSFRSGPVFFICPEPDGTCELCGKTAETRPYGPKGERICFECGMKDEATTVKQFERIAFGKEKGKGNA